ncbi:MAG: hypothetical protein HY825_08335 [Acidobacteria bacterium]|nr:hypothetical protein [Acidobacteriota bacterium]
MTRGVLAAGTLLAVLAVTAPAAEPPTPPGPGSSSFPRNLGGQPPPRMGPDITSGRGIVVGGEVGGQGGKLVPWGGTVVLTRRDAVSPRSGTCAFNIAYDEVNREPLPTGTSFVNVLRRGGLEVSRQTNRHLGPDEVRRVFTQAYLASGPATHTLSLTLDAERTIAETNEANNRFEITYLLKEDCAPPTPPAR